MPTLFLTKAPKTYDGEKTAPSRNVAGKRAGNTLEVIGIGKDFLSRTPVVQQLRERMDKWDYMK
jgi:hypothetical protein